MLTVLHLHHSNELVGKFSYFMMIKVSLTQVPLDVATDPCVGGAVRNLPSNVTLLSFSVLRTITLDVHVFIITCE